MKTNYEIVNNDTPTITQKKINNNGEIETSVHLETFPNKAGNDHRL